MVELLLADDHRIFRTGIARLLSDEPDIRVAAEAGSASEVLSVLRDKKVSVVSLDINLGTQSGLEVLRSIRSFSKVPVLMMSMHSEEQFALASLRAGANGYINKDSEPAELLQAIRSVARGEQYLSQHAAAIVRNHGDTGENRPAHERLSSKEMQILLMMIRGMSLTEIGQEMLISVKTVGTHRTSILEKLGVSNNAEMVLYAVRAGLIQ